MGASCSVKKEKMSKILLLGLDSAGKTTMLYKLKQMDVPTCPTAGFNVEYVYMTPEEGLVVWDLGGQKKLRPLWRHHFDGINGILFVIDSSDRSRIEEAKEELFDLLEEDGTKNFPLVIVANKQDMPNVMSINEIALALELEQITGRIWQLQGASATTGVGLYPAMLKMSQMIKNNK